MAEQNAPREHGAPVDGGTWKEDGAPCRDGRAREAGNRLPVSTHVAECARNRRTTARRFLVVHAATPLA